MEINSINLVGRAGREPDVRYFESGSIVANFTLAVNRRSRDEEPDWFNLEIWGKQAQIAADYVRKGSLIGINGSFKISTCFFVKAKHIKPLPCLAMKFIFFELHLEAGITKSPSFSLFLSSTRINIFPFFASCIIDEIFENFIFGI